MRRWLSPLLSLLFAKTSKVKEDDIEAATRRMQDMKAESKGASPLSAGDVTLPEPRTHHSSPGDACMGSSAMGAGVLRKKNARMQVCRRFRSLTWSSNNLPPDADLRIDFILYPDFTAMRSIPFTPDFVGHILEQRPVHQPDRRCCSCPAPY
ncbi:hypothetical protein ACLB1Q_22855 [Escherichia coli]